MLEETEAHHLHCYYNAIPTTLKNNIYHSNKRGPPPFFHSDTSPVLGQVLVYSIDKIHILVATVKLIKRCEIVVPKYIKTKSCI